MTAVAIECPACKTVTYLEQPFIHNGSEFCRNSKCQFPLFWTPNAQAVADPTADWVIGRRRLPGAAGHAGEIGPTCPRCKELNPLSVRYCVRCQNDLYPPPPPPVVALPPPAPAPPPPPAPVVPPPPEPRTAWLYALGWWAVIMIFLVVPLIVWATR